MKYLEVAAVGLLAAIILVVVAYHVAGMILSSLTKKEMARADALKKAEGIRQVQFYENLFHQQMEEFSRLANANLPLDDILAGIKATADKHNYEAKKYGIGTRIDVHTRRN